jgi:hypothetical protein
VLAAATGAGNGELCGLERADLDLDTGTVRFRQALTIVDPAVLPAAAFGDSDGDGGASGVGGRRKELAVGPLKSAASNAILTLPPFAVQAFRQHRRQQARLRLAMGQPATTELRSSSPAGHPTRSSSTWCSAPSGAPRSTPTTPSPAWPPASAWSPTRTCCAMPWPRPWPPTRNRPASSPPSSATPTAAPSPSGSTSTSSLDRPPAGRTHRRGVRPNGAEHASGVGGGVRWREPERNRSVEPGLTRRSAATNRSFASWGEIVEDDAVAAAILDCLLGNAVVINIRGESYRMRTHRRLLEETRKGVITTT